MPDSLRPPGAVRRRAVSRPAVVDALVALGYLLVSGTSLALVWLATGDGRPLGVDVVLGVSTLGTGAQTGPQAGTAPGRSRPAEADRARASVRAAA